MREISEKEREDRVEVIEKLINRPINSNKEWEHFVDHVLGLGELKDLNIIDDAIELSKDDLDDEAKAMKVAAIAFIANFKIKLIIEDIEKGRMIDPLILEKIEESFKRRWTLELALDQLKKEANQISGKKSNLKEKIFKARLLQLAGDVSFMLTTESLMEI